MALVFAQRRKTVLSCLGRVPRPAGEAWRFHHPLCLLHAREAGDLLELVSIRTSASETSLRN